MISSEENENAWHVANTKPRDIHWKLPHCSNKSSNMIDFLCVCSCCCRPFSSISWKQSTDCIPTGQGYKVGQSKTCYKKNYRSPCHSCMTVWLYDLWLYDIFVRMQFERAVPWHRDSWVVWVLKLRCEICEILRGPVSFFSVYQLEVKPLPM